MSLSSLAAFHLTSHGGEWLKSIPTALTREGYSTEKRRNSIDVWNPASRQQLPHGNFFIDGWSVQRLWLGHGNHALGVLPRRIYLQKDGTRDIRPERFIINLRSKPKTSLSVRLNLLKQFMQLLKRTCSTDLGDQISLEFGDCDLLAGASLHGSRGSLSANTKLCHVHQRCGFNNVECQLQIGTCCDDGVSSIHTDDYARRAQEEFLLRGVHCNFKNVTLEQLEIHLDAITELKCCELQRTTILFMLKQNQSTPSNRLTQIMQRMDELGLSWRRAYASDDRTWSVPDQLGSLLMSFGGHPHSVQISDGESLPWSIGIDLSHRKDFSRAAVALIDPIGRLAGKWTLDQELREDIDFTTLRQLLQAAAHAIPESSRSSGMLIVRDGRLFERENAEFYRKGLGGPVSLVEIRKYGNPPLLLGEDELPPGKPAVAWIADSPGESIGFLVTLPRKCRDEFDSVIKVRMPDAWDGMKLGRERLARILAAQTLTPGLGLHPRYLPAPIYWADGIAGASSTDLRFRGQSAIRIYKKVGALHEQR